ncbi:MULTISPECIES: valine--tRNA ligase [Cyanophyceae]|uniref:valine--tRNA ligase n=1 Tax=Cyanophyceae TaxID=3028117 RepID=UPI00016DC412|nr:MULTISPECIES: valine--tRNA ligase [Cyanophyceae]ACA99214.1 valyl-tRNA synthetase [Picosynechococcus sp. PCC 7002]SMH33734.1 valyl-tRNA synthetase [Picosynechococcus sp. OG1]SMQ84458.1 valyl-tRNA synthetase [Synechococcus sp. 7002]
MTTDIPNLPSQYDPHNTENKWQQTWFERSVFRADPQKKGDPFCIVIPPPNVTGKLHMGHAFNTSLIDTVVRYHRMKGENVLCLPGTDHASIAVQTLVEKQIKAEGKTRYDLGREKFLEKAWEWKAESGGAIINQLKRLGLSADWTRERFTLDENLCEAVKKAFITLYEEGLIYRGNYLVNWCPESQSAVSDLEVENKEIDGHLWHFRYPLSDGSGYVEVATTRPETMLGDTGVAVNPNDERYKNLIGKTLTLPIVGREIPVFADEHVDPEFGTGCVKVTPAHDPNDFEMGKRHNLEFINIMNRDGTLNENAGMFAGQDRFEARKNLVAKLKEDGVLVKTEDYRHSVPHSDRGKVPVEPLLSTQWFVKIDPLAQKTLAFLDEENQPNYVPERWRKVYRDWLVKLNDWCISRQLWWGHQIPAWYVVSETNGEIQDHTPFIVAHDEAEAKQKAIAAYGADCQLEQDPDVLDTWFSSGLWPFSTLGWPDNSEDFQKYFPNSVLVTGFDIIFFWVARMTMMSSHFTGKIPFKDVYIHGLVRDENGKKMSKSANNGIDPLLMCDRYGTDALRYTLIREVAGAGQDISLQYDRKTDESQSVEASRNFANKLWNAARFVMMNLDGKTPTDLGRPAMADLELGDRWILSRLHQVIADTHKNLEGYGLGEAAKALYEFIWGDFCDWYIELVKPRLYAKEAQDQASRTVAQQILAWVLEDILKLLHPFMPHITEEIWQTLTQADGQTFLATQLFPAENDQLVDTSLEDEFALLIEAIRTIRNLRAEAGIKPGATVTVILQSETETELNTLAKGEAYILKLAKVETLKLTNTVDNSLKQAIAGVVGTIQVLIPLEGLVDIPALRSKLEKNLVKVNKEIQSLSGRLNNPGFVNKAPAEVIEGARSALTEAEAQQSILTERLQRLQ